ncbi:hypothetical protein BAE44_0010826, partial [Dichanthelium oligosanthes]
MAATYNFDLLELADGESGDAAVSVIVGKKKTEAVAAKPADAAEAAAKEKAAATRHFYYTKLQHDNGVRKCEQEMKRLRKVLIKLRGDEAKLKEQGGNEGRIRELSEEQRKLRQEQRKLRQEEAILVPLRNAFYTEHNITLPVNKKRSGNNLQGANADSGSNSEDVNGNVCNNNGGGNCGYSERQVYVPKVKASSDDGTEAEEKLKGNVLFASETEQKEANADNAYAVPASEFSRDAAQGGPNNGQGAQTGTSRPFQKERLNGSEKRKKRNSKKKSGNEPEKVRKQDSGVDGSNKQAAQTKVSAHNGNGASGHGNGAARGDYYAPPGDG